MGSNTSPVEGPGTILVIEDEEELRALARVILEHRGFQVLEAPDGLEGIDTFRRHAARIRLVLLDLSMPRLGGNEVLRYIRGLRADVPVLLTSGGDAGDVDAFPRTGFLPKPFTPDQLVRAIEQLLEQA